MAEIAALQLEDEKYGDSNMERAARKLADNDVKVENSEIATTMSQVNIQYVSPYDINPYRNFKSILGKNPLQWLNPFAAPDLEGEGVAFEVRDDIVNTNEIMKMTYKYRHAKVEADRDEYRKRIEENKRRARMLEQSDPMLGGGEATSVGDSFRRGGAVPAPSNPLSEQALAARAAEKADADRKYSGDHGD